MFKCDMKERQFSVPVQVTHEAQDTLLTNLLSSIFHKNISSFKADKCLFVLIEDYATCSNKRNIWEIYQYFEVKNKMIQETMVKI